MRLLERQEAPPQPIIALVVRDREDMALTGRHRVQTAPDQKDLVLVEANLFRLVDGDQAVFDVLDLVKPARFQVREVDFTAIRQLTVMRPFAVVPPLGGDEDLFELLDFNEFEERLLRRVDQLAKRMPADQDVCARPLDRMPERRHADRVGLPSAESRHRRDFELACENNLSLQTIIFATKKMLQAEFFLEVHLVKGHTPRTPAATHPLFQTL